MSGKKMITTERLDELQRLADEATPGDWKVEEGTPLIWGGCIESEVFDFYMGRPIAEVRMAQPTWDRTGKPMCGPENAVFIATARTAVPDLLAEVRRLQAEVHELTDPRYSRVSNERLQENHDAMLELQAENAALCEALKPFAAEGGAWRNRRLKDEEWVSGYALMRDLRRAAKLVEDTEC